MPSSSAQRSAARLSSSDKSSSTFARLFSATSVCCSSFRERSARVARSLTSSSASSFAVRDSLSVGRCSVEERDRRQEILRQWSHRFSVLSSGSEFSHNVLTAPFLAGGYLGAQSADLRVVSSALENQRGDRQDQAEARSIGPHGLRGSLENLQQASEEFEHRICRLLPLRRPK